MRFAVYRQRLIDKVFSLYICTMNINPDNNVIGLSYSKEDLLELDLSVHNSELEKITSQKELEYYIKDLLRKSRKSYAIGGYAENRQVYRRFKHFDQQDSKRRIHLGIDFWAPAGTSILAPLEGVVHSWAFNDNPGDYGGTLIVEHKIMGERFYSLYGHLALYDLQYLKKGQSVKPGELIARLGDYPENGGWPPHLHFQLIRNMEGKSGDYPGVVEQGESEAYLKNCPNPIAFF